MSDSVPELVPRKTAGSVSLGITVVVLYVVFVFTVFAGFGSYIYRGEWVDNLRAGAVQSGEAGANASLLASAQATPPKISDLDNLIFIIKRKKELNTNLRQYRSELLTHQKDVARLEADYRAAIGANIRQASQVLSESREDIKMLTKILGVAHTDYLKQLDEIELFELEPHEKIDRAHSLVGYISVPLELDAMTLTRFNAAMSTFRAKKAVVADTLKTTTDQALARRSEQRQVEALINQLISEQEDIQTELRSLEAMVPLGSPHQARHEALYFDVPIPYFGRYISTSFQRLVSFPTIFLTLIVTIAAGALGTVVAFSRRYYHKDSRGLTMSRLFVNVGEGIAAAIAIFLFSGAGMLALTQGGGSQSAVELSPYTVAFVAFLSGFMAEDAFASIQAAGRRIFKSGDAERAKEEAEAKAEKARAAAEKAKEPAAVNKPKPGEGKPVAVAADA